MCGILNCSQLKLVNNNKKKLGILQFGSVKKKYEHSILEIIKSGWNGVFQYWDIESCKPHPYIIING